jgi:hypothetical protein
MRTGKTSAGMFRIARLIWIGGAVASLVTVIASVVPRYQQLALITADAALATGQLRPLEAQALADIGLPVGFYAAYITSLEILASLIFLIVGVIIFRLRSNEWEPLLFSFILVSYGVASSPLTTPLELFHPAWAILLICLRSMALVSLMLALMLFPDGRFVPSWVKWLAAIWIAYVFLSLLIPPLRFTASVIWENKLQAFTFIWALMWLLTVAAIQAFRYRYRSSPAQRQQTKWVVFGLVVGVTSSIAASVIALWTSYFFESMSIILITRLAAVTVILLSTIFMGVSFSIAVLHSHLWDIDVIIRKTLVYGSLSLTLALVFFSSVILLQSLVAAVGGQQSAVVTVISTLLIAALFNPLRRRIQSDIDRRFFRKKYDAEKTIAAFSAGLRQEVDLEQIGERLLLVVEETMQPEIVSLWLRNAEKEKR